MIEFGTLRRAKRGLAAAGLALAGMAWLIGCGGGGGVDTGGTGAFQAYTQGSIAGYGSIVVNGVHYDETQSRISDDDGQLLSVADLQLGIVVQIDSSHFDAQALTATADAIRISSALAGPVSAVDPVANTLTMLGQTVKVTQLTFFDSVLAGGLPQVTVNSLVEVYAIYDPVSNVYAARRIESRPSLAAYKVRGQVQAIDRLTQTCRIGTETYSYAPGPAPEDLANGQELRFNLLTVRDAQGRWQISSGTKADARPADGSQVEIESVITRYDALSSFTLSGLTVDASQALVTPTGALLSAGVQVEVEGVMRGGVLQAAKLEVRPHDDGDDSEQEIEISGKITAIDTQAKTLIIRGQVISYASGVSYSGGGEADLAVGKKIELTGVLAGDGIQILATEIQFDD